MDEYGGIDFPSRGIGPDFALEDVEIGRGSLGGPRVCSFMSRPAPVEPRKDLEAEYELQLLRRLYGGVSSQKERLYFKFVKKKWEYETAEYMIDRSAFFGSIEDYESYKAKCKEELDAGKEALRRVIEPPVKDRKPHADWRLAQDVFYAWTKKAFDREILEKDAKATPDFAAVIKAQMSETLKAKLDTVQKGYKTTFKYGGFNPRPQKNSNGYILGTLSKHGLGTAIDIDDAKNPIIDAKEWKLILAYTGKTWDDPALTKKWKAKDAASAKEVYDALKGISDEWVSRLDKAVKASEEAAKKKADDDAKKRADEEAAKKKAPEGAKTSSPAANTPAKAAPPAAPIDHLAAVIAADENLKKIGAAWVKQWKGGFLNHEWDLVKELHSAGFMWGALFPNIDIHHFQL
jgi:hypothetical protein